MARQSKNQVVGRFIGIDPGEAHCGWARIVAYPEVCHVEIGTYSIADHAFQSLIDRLIDYPGMFIAVEEYRARPVGHQRFNEGQTAQLIGGLKYRASHLECEAFRLIPTADPVKGLKGYRLDALVDMLADDRVQPGNSRWNHAFSGLRVLAAGMFNSQHQKLLYQLSQGYAKRNSESIVYDGDLSSGVIRSML